MTPFLPDNAAVWFEIPVTDMVRAKKFYGAVLQNELTDDDNGPNPMALFAVKDIKTGIAGHIYPGKPAPEGAGNTIHLAVSAPLEEAMGRVAANGGKVVSDTVTIPAGRFVYCLDPDGNSFGLFTYT